MATVKFSGIVSDVRGKIGGVVFSRGANGSYVRTLVKPSKKLTESLMIKRANLAFYAADWRELSDLQRTAWNQAVVQYPYQNRVGDTSTYTGFQLYMKINMTLETAALDS